MALVKTKAVGVPKAGVINVGGKHQIGGSRSGRARGGVKIVKLGGAGSGNRYRSQGKGSGYGYRSGKHRTLQKGEGLASRSGGNRSIICVSQKLYRSSFGRGEKRAGSELERSGRGGSCSSFQVEDGGRPRRPYPDVARCVNHKRGRIRRRVIH